MNGFGYYIYNGKFFQVWGPAKNVNPDLMWEKGKNWNVGIDFSLLNNRIYGSLNYFNRKQQDLLGDYKVSVPPYLFDNTFVNVGTMKNYGLSLISISVQLLPRISLTTSTSSVLPCRISS